MIDIGSVAALAGSLKAAGEITKAMVGLRDTAMMQSKVIELNGIILSAQSSALEANIAQSNLLERVRNLEKEIAQLEAWDTEKEKYDLKSISGNTFAYASKTNGQPSGPSHLICATCYEHRKKSLLQRADSAHLFCPECKTRLKFDSTESQAFRRPINYDDGDNGPDSWMGR
jgi:hypothetical protein